MRWNTRIAILAGVGCVIASVLYFRVFQPGLSYSAIAINFQEAPAAPFELVMANQSRLEQRKSEEQARSAELSKSTGQIGAASEAKAKQEQAEPILMKKPPKAPAPAKGIVVETPSKPQRRIYTAKSGDSLWSIAREQLGDASRHVELAKLNEAVLDGDADNLKPGQKIILPAK